MRIMKAFEIEKDYQRHRTRLKEICSFDSKRRVCYSTSNVMRQIDCFNKKKHISLLHQEFEKDREIMIANKALHRMLTHTYTADPSKKIIRCITTQCKMSIDRSQSRTSVRSQSSSRIREQNSKLVKKLNETQSRYKKFRTRKRESNNIKKLEGQLLPKETKKIFPSVPKNPCKSAQKRTLSYSERK